MKADIEVKLFKGTYIPDYYDWWQWQEIGVDFLYIKEQFLAIILDYADPVEL